MHRICVVGRTYEQAYPQKLGREFGGNNIVDSSHKTPVDITSFSLSMGFLEDKSWKGNFLGSGGALLLAGLLLGLRERGLGNREDGTHGSLQPLKWRFGVGMVSIVSPLHGRSTMTPYNGFVFPLLPPQDVPKDQKKRFNGLFANLQTRYRDETLVDMVI